MWCYKTLEVDTTGWLGGKIDEAALEDKLNDLGMRGWELVSAVTTQQADGITRHLVLLFKRPYGDQDARADVP